MRIRILAAAGGLLLVLPSLAEADPGPSAGGVVDPVIVTRLPEAPAETVGVQVIDARQIELIQAATPRDVLNTVPGLAVERSGAYGGLISVRQRGAASDKTLILLDGVALNDPSQPSGGTDLALIDMADIGRVEVLSGPQGSLWGSDAIGGVIAFTSRPPEGWRAALEAGSAGYARAAIGAGLRRGRFEGGLTAAGWRADGISAADRRDGNTEADAGWAWTLAARGRLQLADTLALSAQVRRVQSRSDTDGYPPPAFVFADTAEVARNTTWFGHIGLEGRGLGLSHRLTYAAWDIDRSNLGGAFPARFTGRRQTARYVVSRGEPEDRFSAQAGLDWEADRASLSDGSRLSRHTAGLFLVARARPSTQTSLTGSLRYDDPSGFGSALTARLAGVWSPGGGLAISAAWGQGFKTPTLSQMACDFCFPGGPSTGLRAEHAEGEEIGAAWRAANGRTELRVTAWRLGVRDQIDFSASFPFRYANLKETRGEGVEASAEQALGDAWRLRAVYAWTDAVNVATGEALLRIPRQAGSLSLSYTEGRLSGIATIRAEGPQADSGGRRPGFVTANLAAAWSVTRRLDLTLRVENLTDARYQEVLGYGEPGLSAYVGVRMRGD